MSLDGLRAWIGEVERKLGMRTRVFLALTVIAIGGAGAGIYLAIDARDSSVSESDVQALQEQLEARIDEGGGTPGTATTQLESELGALKAQVERLEAEGGGKGAANGSEGTSGGAEEAPSGTAGAGASGEGTDRAKLKQLFEQAQAQGTQAEGTQAEK